jgi:type IV pilus biogenesis protein CpaD/CtpE
MSRPVKRSAMAALLLAALGGCTATEPYLRPGVWTPTGANAANLAAMVEDPQDLVQGRAPGLSDGARAAAAVDRLRQGKTKSLGGGSDTQAAQPAAAAANAAASLGGN